MSLMGTLIVVVVAASPTMQNRLIVGLFGGWMLSTGLAWLCNGLFAMRVYAENPALWVALGRPEVNDAFGAVRTDRTRAFFFRRLDPAEYPARLLRQRNICRLLYLLSFAMFVAMCVSVRYSRRVI